MLKRSATLLLCLLLTMSLLLPVMGEELSRDQRIRKLASIFREYIAESQYKGYEYDENKHRFSAIFDLDSALSQCDVITFIYYDQLAVRARPRLQVPEKYRDNVAIFITKANNELYYAQLLLDYEDGYISCRGMQSVEAVFPSTEEIGVVHGMAIHSLDEWGNGLVRVAAGADPHITFEETLKEIDEDY